MSHAQEHIEKLSCPFAIKSTANTLRANEEIVSYNSTDNTTIVKNANSYVLIEFISYVHDKDNN